MQVNDFILETLNQVQAALTTAVDSLTPAEIKWRPNPEANSIGFMLWHLARCEDMFVLATIQRKPQVWVEQKWYEKLRLPENPRDVGYGYTVEQLAAFPVPQLDGLLGYAAAVRARTVEYLKNTTADKFDELIQTRVFGERNVGQIFAHLLCEITEHVGQIAYLRGLQRGLNK